MEAMFGRCFLIPLNANKGTSNGGLFFSFVRLVIQNAEGSIKFQRN